MILMTAFGLTVDAWAQIDRGAIKGEVQDSEHANIPNAQITLKNEATGVTATTASGPSGQFSFLNLPAGVYTLTSTATGFSTSVQQHITVGVGSTFGLTVTLQPGQVAQTVTVSENAATVETQTSDIGTVITPQEIRDLPVSLNGDMRNPLNFVTLTPGVSGSTPGASPDYRLHISGSNSYANEVYIDGVPVMNTNLGGDIGANHPPIDAIGQFKIINNNQSAQYGLASGIVSFAFNSGTNDYHGSLFDYLQNDALNAAGFVTNALGLKKAPLKQNEFGGTFGGPVWIPKLYNGRDKTFFFVDYTGFKFRPSSNNGTLTTIPNAFRTGDFSQVLGAQLMANGKPVFDPAGRPIYNGEIYDPTSVHVVVGPDGNSYQVRDPFPGNIIPSGQPGLSTVSQTIMKSFPMADNDAVNNNFHRLQSSKIDEHRLVVKIDEHISEKHSVAGSLFFGGYSNSNNGGLNLLDSLTSTTPTKQIRFTYNYTHSPTLVNNLNFGFIRDTNFSGPLQPGPGLEALGIQGLPPLASDSPFPIIGIGTVQNSIGSATASTDAENRYIVSDNVTMVRGSHTFTVGGELRYLRRDEGGLPGGNFTFEPTQTALNGTGFINGNEAVSIPSGTGHPAASFLFGGMDFSRFDYPVEAAYRWWQGGLFVQDDWKATSNLTLNLGLRWDLQIPRTDINGKVSTMDPTLANPAAGGLPGAFTYYGSGSGRNGKTRIGDIDYRGFQPRLGFAYSPDGAHKTAIRGGFAITRPIGNDNAENGIGGGLYNTGFAGLATVNRPQDYVGSPAYYWDNPYPASSISNGPDLDPGALVGNDNPPMIRPSSGIPPTQIYWSTQVQQEMPGGMVASIGYVGMHTYHLGVWSKPNQVDPAVMEKYSDAAAAAEMPLNQFMVLPVDDPRAMAAGIKIPFPNFIPIFGAGATVGQSLRPFPQYGDVDNPLNPIGSVSYNGLQTSLQKRYAHGLTLLLSYTFSKTIGNVDSNQGATSGAENAIYAGSFYQDYYNPQAQRSVTSSDIPHVLSLSYTYELPMGPGKRYLNHKGVVGRVVGGWSVSGIHHYQSGRPIHIEYDAFGANNPSYSSDGFSFRPDVVNGVPLKNPAYNKKCSGPILAASGRQPCQFLINPAAFATPAPGKFGNAPNLFSSLRMPAYINEDLSLTKRTTIYGRANLLFQANFFNALNRTIFSSGGNAQTFIINNAPPDLSADSLRNSNTVFGLMTAQQNAPRIIQFGMRLEF
jgi:hypothetical protein